MTPAQFDYKNKSVVVYLGTRKLVAMLADMKETNPKILHKEEMIFPEGFEKGLVCNLQNATASLEKLLSILLPPEAWEHIPVHVVLGNSRFKMCRFSSCEYYAPEKHTVSSHEIQSVVQQTRSVAMLPLTEAILQAIPESFLVNDMPAVRNPIGLEAERLGVTLQIYTMDFQSFRNIQKVFEAVDINVAGYFPKTLTVSEAVLNESEKQEGVLIIDIADDATQLVLWKNGYLAGGKSLPIGGHYLTKRLAADYNIEERDADKVKAKFGTLDENDRMSEELVPLVLRNEKVQQSVRRKEFIEKFFGHSKELMTQVLDEAKKFAEEEKARYPHIVFTGGAVMMDGFLEWLHKEFSVEGRLGITRFVEAGQEIVRDPSLAPALGMFRWVMTEQRDNAALFTPRGIVAKIVVAVRTWFTNYF